MAYSITVMPSAVRDMDAYAEFIAKDSPSRAKIWLTGAWETIFSLKDFPQRYMLIVEAEQLQTEIRDVRYFSHRIIYRICEEKQIVEVLRAWHGARASLNTQELLRSA
jgi:plasmid stabilization system protein ParE